MNSASKICKAAVAVIALAAVAACSSDDADKAVAAEPLDLAAKAPGVSFKPASDEYDGTVAKPGSPYALSYRIVGTPIVGSPVVVDLRVRSSLGPRPVNLDYRINDASSMLFAESQPSSVRMEPADNENEIRQQVTVIPQREGRLYLNVSASFEDEGSTVSTVMAVPIQVGTGTRELIEHGTVRMDENDEAVRVLKNDD